MAAVEHRAHSVILLLTDGLGGDQMEVVRGAYGVVGAEIPLVGGCAGDDLKMKRTYQLFGDRVLQDSVVAAALLRRPDRYRRQPRLAAGRRADAGHRQRRQPGPHPRRPARARRLPAPVERPGGGPRRPRRLHPLRPHPSPRHQPPQRRGGPLRRRGRLRRPLARLHRQRPPGRAGLDHGGRRRLGPGGHRRGLRRGAGGLGGEPARPARLRLHRPARRPRRRRHPPGRSSASPPSPAGRRSPASTPTARSPAPPGGAGSTTRPSSSWRWARPSDTPAEPVRRATGGGAGDPGRVVDRAAAIQGAVERIAECFDSEVGGSFGAGHRGLGRLPPGRPAAGGADRRGRAEAGTLDVPGAGRCRAVVVPVPSDTPCGWCWPVRATTGSASRR